MLKMKFSQIEIRHLLKSWLAISLAFTILNTGLSFSGFALYFIISMITVGLGFVFHELAHKLVAQRYGIFAEYRANDQMLLIGILTAVFGFIFIAPGAVILQGIVTKKRNGLISLAGPVSNIILAIMFLAGSLIAASPLLAMVFSYGFRINYFLAIFNMIPIMNFDGRKILHYNKIIYFSTAAAALLLLPIQQVLLQVI